MADIGLNQNITIRNREFHFQTATNIEDGLIRTEVFEQGRLLYSQEHKYERRARASEEGGEPRIKASLDYFHKNVISDLQIFFELSKILENQEQSISHYRLGTIFFSLRIYDKAEFHLKKAMELDPNQYNSLIALARCHFYQKKFKDSEALLQSLIKKDITYPDLYNLLGMVLFEQNNHIQSMNHFRQAIKLNPDYKEAYFNIAVTIFQRIHHLKTQQNDAEIQKNHDFLEVILNKIHKIGDAEDRSFILELKRSFSKKNFGKIHSLIHDYRHRLFHRRVLPEIIGYEFYLWLHHLSDRLGYEKLLYFERKFSKNLEQYADYADMWNYLALIHLLLCRDYFLQGLNNFKEATKINPKFNKAKNNLRLVQNDGREFLSLIKAIIS